MMRDVVDNGGLLLGQLARPIHGLLVSMSRCHTTSDHTMPHDLHHHRDVHTDDVYTA